MGEAGARMRELERCIELVAYVLVSNAAPGQRRKLREGFSQAAEATWSLSLPTAAGTLRKLAEQVPPGEGDPEPF